MTRPLLSPGGRIGVMAPSSYVEKDDIERSAALMKERGYEVFIHPQTYERDRQSAGTVLQKSLALQGLWQRADIDAVWCAGGGNRALHLLDSINFTTMKNKPKALIGFSDATALLNGLYAHTGIVACHGQVFKNLHRMKPDQLNYMLDLLAGKTTTFPMESSIVLNDGKARGPLVGGNLSVFHYMPQTLPGEFWKGGILFLEDCNEELSKIDRMLLHLKRTGVLKSISGLIFGQFTDMQDTGRPYGFALEEIVREHTEGLDIPVILNAPFGHGGDLYALPVGANGVLTATSGKTSLNFK